MSYLYLIWIYAGRIFTSSLNECCFSLQDKMMTIQVKIKPIKQNLRSTWIFRVALMTSNVKGRKKQKKRKVEFLLWTRYISYMARKWYLHKKSHLTVCKYIAQINYELKRQQIQTLVLQFFKDRLKISFSKIKGFDNITITKMLNSICK